MSENDKKIEFFSEETLKPARAMKMRKGADVDAPVLFRWSKLNPGHVSLIAHHRMMRELPTKAAELEEETIDLDQCRFCRPDTLCTEAEEERTQFTVQGKEYILAGNPFYYLPGHAVLFPATGPHQLKEATETDWKGLIAAGVAAAEKNIELRFGFNAGTYLCCGGSQRHLHLQMVPMKTLAPNEEALQESLLVGASFEQLKTAFQEKGLIIEAPDEVEAFLAASWAPKFNLEMVAVFADPKRFSDLNPPESDLLAKWIHKTATRFVVPQGGGLNGYGLEVPGMPYMVRLLPRLPGAVQAFMETGAGYMVISALPESLPGWWEGKQTR
ncbi:MAG: hypothetical protein KJ645_07215 [Planctomycetes bacterium]|nr:hypothetical protein [Planctomycetota bacterium]